MALLKPQSVKNKTVSFRLPSQVVADLEAVKEEAAQRGFSIDITEQIERAIVALIKQARAELSAAPKGGA
jgi:hypothetical protein